MIPPRPTHRPKIQAHEAFLIGLASALFIWAVTRDMPAVQAQGSPPLEAPLEIEAVTSDPTSFLGETLRLPFSFAKREEASWNPYLTRFSPSDYRLIHGWSDQQFPWNEADWDAPRTQLFVRRGTPLETWAQGLEVHQRWLVTAVPRALFAGRLWLEVVNYEAADTAVGEGCILHASRALENYGLGRPNTAIADLERALASPLPTQAREELERLMGHCQRLAEDIRRDPPLPEELTPEPVSGEPNSRSSVPAK